MQDLGIEARALMSGLHPHFNIHLIYPINPILTIQIRTRQTTLILIIITPIKEPTHPREHNHRLQSMKMIKTSNLLAE